MFGCLNGEKKRKRPLGSEARDKNAVIALTSPPSCLYFLNSSLLHHHRNKHGWRSAAVRSSSVLWYEFLRVLLLLLLHSCVTGRLTVQKQTSQVKGHPDKAEGEGGKGGVKGRCAHSEPVLDPLTKRDVNRKTNEYRHSHEAALWRSYIKILFSISCFSFLFAK